MYSGGDRWDGVWREGQKDGKGTYYASDGWKFEGVWKADKPQAKGVLTLKDGSCKEFEWPAVRCKSVQIPHRHSNIT